MGMKRGEMSVSLASLQLPIPSSALVRRWRLLHKHKMSIVVHRGNRQTLCALANANASSGKDRRKVEVIMVDPLEAKRLAAKQMQEFQAKEKLKRRRQIEAINGAWAMIGLTAGLVVEGHTGNSIVTQVVGYFTAIVGFFWQ